MINYFWLIAFTAVCLSSYIFFPGKLQFADTNLPFEHVFHIGLPLADQAFINLGYALTFICLQGIMLADLVIKNRMSRALSIIPGGVMVLFCCWSLDNYALHHILLANFFFILSIRRMFMLYKKHKPIATTFNTGFFLGLASLFYQPYMYFIIVLILGQMSLRGLKLQEVLQLIFAFLCPVFLTAVLLNNHGQVSDLYTYFTPSFSIPEIDLSDIPTLIRLIVVMLLLIYLVTLQQHLLKKKKFDAIKKIELCYWLLLFGFISFFMAPEQELVHLLIISLPISILTGLFLEERDNAIIKEFMFLMFFILYLSLQFDLV